MLLKLRLTVDSGLTTGAQFVDGCAAEQFGTIPHDHPSGPLGKFGSILAVNGADYAVFAGCAGS